MFEQAKAMVGRSNIFIGREYYYCLCYREMSKVYVGSILVQC
uniref:Uncharacterized protein n=1 Tax=Arundo donax TaxID=35708 RepID=A0A0A9ARK1_ARUDO